MKARSGARQNINMVSRQTVNRNSSSPNYRLLTGYFGTWGVSGHHFWKEEAGTTEVRVPQQWIAWVLLMFSRSD